MLKTTTHASGNMIPDVTPVFITDTNSAKQIVIMVFSLVGICLLLMVVCLIYTGTARCRSREGDEDSEYVDSQAAGRSNVCYSGDYATQTTYGGDTVFNRQASEDP